MGGPQLIGRLGLVLALGFVSGCTAEIGVPDASLLSCETAADCPPLWTCGRDRCLPPGVVEDVTAPGLVALESVNATTILVTFDEPVDPLSIATAADFTIDPALDIVAVGAEEQSVRLITADQDIGVTYTLTVKHVADLAGNVVDPPGLFDTFTGGGTPPDPSPPDLLAPEDGARFFGGSVVLVWSRRSKATRYTVELSRSPDFSTEDRPDLEVDTTSLNLSEALTEPLTPHTWYWRVSADVTGSTETLPVRSFHVMDSVLYVHCPSGTPCSDQPGIGNLSSPHQSVGPALIDAAANGITEVRVAARGGGQAYAGVVTLITGVSLRGGYNADFTAQNFTANETVLEHDGQFVVGAIAIKRKASTDPDLVVEGFTIRTTPGARLVQASAVYVADTDGSVVFRDNRIQAGFAAGFSYGVEVRNGFDIGPLFTRNEIRSADVAWGESAGMLVAFGGVRIIGNPVIEGAHGGATSYGIRGDGLWVNIQDNPRIASGAAKNCYGIYLSGGSGEVSGNGIVAGSSDQPDGESVGLVRLVSFEGIDDFVATNNDISTGDARTTKGMHLQSEGLVTATGNTITTGDAVSGRYAFSHGIVLKSLGTFDLRDNRIRTGDLLVAAGTDPVLANSAGILIEPPGGAPTPRACRVRLVGNRARGGDGVVTSDPSGSYVASWGLRLSRPACVVEAFSNVFEAGDLSAETAYLTSIGASISTLPNAENSADGVSLYNNDLVARFATSTSGIELSTGLELDCETTSTTLVQDFDVVNNIVVTVGDNAFGAPIRDDGLATCPRALRHNLLFNVNPNAVTDTVYNAGGSSLSDLDSDGSLDAELVGVATTVEGNLTVPALADWTTLFVDPDGTATPSDPTDDFALVSGNPAIDAGVNLYDGGDLVEDILGNPRPACAAPPCDTLTPPWDLGAWEN